MEQIANVGIKAAASQAGISVRRAKVWQKRWDVFDASSPCDRSSRPHASPRTTAPDKREQIIALRRNYRLPYSEITHRTGVSTATVGQICTHAAVAKLPPHETAIPKRRYERKTPGEILHMDTKKLVRFVRPGHRVTGDLSQFSRKPVYHALHVGRAGGFCPPFLPVPGKHKAFPLSPISQ